MKFLDLKYNLYSAFSVSQFFFTLNGLSIYSISFLIDAYMNSHPTLQTLRYNNSQLTPLSIFLKVTAVDI